MSNTQIYVIVTCIIYVIIFNTALLGTVLSYRKLLKVDDKNSVI